MPLAVPGAVDSYQKRDELLVALARGDISWGDYVSREKALSAEWKKIFAEALQQTDAQLAQENQFELLQRQRAMQALAQFLQNQQMINAMNRPVITNCNGFGSSVNCITH